MIQGPQLIIVLAIVLLLFGGSKLPKLARSLGQAQKEFRDGLKEGQDDDAPPVANASSTTPPAAIQPPGAQPPVAQPPVVETPVVETEPASTPRDDDPNRPDA